MKKVLQISNYLYPNFGGIEHVTRCIANVLSENGEFEQKIICFNETASDGDHVCKREETVYDEVDGIEVIRCGCITKKFSQSISLSFGRELDKVMEDFKPDILIFHYPNPYQAAFLMKYLRRDFRFILYWHLDIVRQKLLGKIFHKQSLRLLERADKIVATSPNYVDGSPYLRKYREKCTVIPNCIDESRLTITDKRKKRAEEIRQINKDKIICFAVGRHVKYKGFKYLIEASRLLDDRFHIIIGGKGPLTEELKTLAVGNQNIEFPGMISENDLIAYYQAMDIFCFPSITKNEAFGIAIAEAMYFSKPVVTFHIPGSGVNYVNQKDITGLEVENRDVIAFADAIQYLADDKNLRMRMGFSAKERVKSLFLYSQFQKSVLRLLEMKA